MAESVYTSIIDGVIDRLESIAEDGGTTWWYTPSKVERYPAFTEDHLDASFADQNTTLYVLSDRPEETAHMTMGTSGKESAVMALDISIARAFPGPETPWNQPTPSRGTVQDRLVRDCRKALLKDFADGSATIFGLDSIHSVDVGEADRSAESTYHAAWAIVFVPVRISYNYPVSTP